MPYRLRDGERYTGQIGLMESFGIEAPKPHVISIVGSGTRQSTFETSYSVERYPAAYDYGPSFIADLKFALRREPLDLAILSKIFFLCDKRQLEEWIRGESTGIFSRRAWFFYEFLTGRQLDLPDSGPVRNTPALEPRFHIALSGRPSTRHRVVDNLFGTRAFCPVIRRTRRLDALLATPIRDEVAQLVADCDPDILARAVNYLYTKETKSSYAIEGEHISASRSERFVAALRGAKDFDLSDPAAYVQLQNLIVDQRYAATGWRDFQNFVGETVGGFQELVHCIFPRPDAVPSMMAGLGAVSRRLAADRRIDPVLAAALLSFGFVFIHPFEDGNGRIHRFIIHNVLAQRSLTPTEIIFPVSAAIVRNQAAYDAALETFSGRIMPFVSWQWEHGDHGSVLVENDTADLYRYFDATSLAEYLYERVIETIRKDLHEEIEFIAVFDRSLHAVMDRVDMPDRRAALFTKLCMQNGGRLSPGKRRIFSELSDEEISELEDEIARSRAVSTAA